MYVNLKGILNLVVFFIKLYKHRALNEVAFLCQLVLHQRGFPLNKVILW